MSNKKTEQLGMNPSTASGRLVKDTLFKLAVEAGHKCFRCGEELTRETFSIEHKTPWLDSNNPLKNYFAQENIAFSHLSCNSKASRSGRKKTYLTEEERLAAEKASKKKYRDTIDPETGLTNRQKGYLKTGN